MSDHKDIHQAMVAVMADVDPIAKERTNKEQGFKFRGIDDVYQALQAVMAKHGVFTTSELLKVERDELPTKSGGVKYCTRLQMRYHFRHASGSEVVTDVLGEGMDSGDKAMTKAMAVAHKYALLQAFMIPTEEPKDPDAESHDDIVRKQDNKSLTTPPKPEPETSEKREALLAYLKSVKAQLTPTQIKGLALNITAAGIDDTSLDVVKAYAEVLVKKNAEVIPMDEAAQKFAEGLGGEVIDESANS